jgi:hypothetical protein
MQMWTEPDFLGSSRHGPRARGDVLLDENLSRLLFFIIDRRVAWSARWNAVIPFAPMRRNTVSIARS